MDNETALAAVIADEASNQPHVGKVAVGRVIQNRTRLHFMSDGTIMGTILQPMQFSGLWCDFTNGHYGRVIFTHDAAAARLASKATNYAKSPGNWMDCLLAARQALGEASFVTNEPGYASLTDETVNYLNPKVVHPLPAWASADKLDAVIYDHSFYHR